MNPNLEKLKPLEGVNQEAFLRNVEVRLAMLGKNKSWVASILSVTHQAIQSRLRRTLNAYSLGWWAIVLAVPADALLDPEPNSVGSVPLPPKGWENGIVKALEIYEEDLRQDAAAEAERREQERAEEREREKAERKAARSAEKAPQSPVEESPEGEQGAKA